MGAPMAASMGLQIAGGAYSAYAQGEAGKAESSYYGYLANTARINAGLARAAGESQAQEIGYQLSQEERRLGEHVRGTVSSQKAGLAAGGAGVGSKTAEQIVSDTLNKGNIDEMALRYNADLKRKAALTGAEFQALGYKSQADGYDLSGHNARITAGMNQVSTILGTGTSVGSTWYRRSVNSPMIG